MEKAEIQALIREAFAAQKFAYELRRAHSSVQGRQRGCARV